VRKKVVFKGGVPHNKGRENGMGRDRGRKTHSEKKFWVTKSARAWGPGSLQRGGTAGGKDRGVRGAKWGGGGEAPTG